MGDFLPLSARSNPAKAAEFKVLHDGVPAWLKDSLATWVALQMPQSESAREAWIRAVERSFRRAIPADVLFTLEGSFFRLLKADPDFFLDVVDWVLRQPTSDGASLEVILSEAGSVWTVRAGRLGDRVSEETAVMAQAVIASDQRASAHIADAWKKGFGRGPDPTGAYSEAIKGAEAALASIVSPKNEKATLGTIIKDIENAPTKFVVRLDSPDMDGIDAFVQQLKLLWKGHRARHGSPDASISQDVPPEKAQDAVVLATTIVHWAQSGAFDTAAN